MTLDWKEEFSKIKYDPVCLKQELYLSLTEQVIKKIEEVKWSYDTIALKLDVDTSWITNFLRCEIDNIDIDMICKICSILHIDIKFKFN